MQNTINVALVNVSVRSVHIDVDFEKISEDALFETAGKSVLKLPKAEGDRSFVLESTFETSSAEDQNIFNASVVADFFFELDGDLDNYDDIIRKQCLPIIRNRITEIENKVLAGMGYSEFLRARE